MNHTFICRLLQLRSQPQSRLKVRRDGGSPAKSKTQRPSREPWGGVVCTELEGYIGADREDGRQGVFWEGETA